MERTFFFARAQKIEITGSTFSIYHDTEFREADVDIELCAPVKGNGEGKNPILFWHDRTQSRIWPAQWSIGDFANIKASLS